MGFQIVCSAFIHSVVCSTTGLQPLPKWVLHRVQSSASSVNLQHPFVSLRSSSSCLCLLSFSPVTSIFPSIIWFRRKFLCKMWPIQLAFPLFIVCRILLSSSALCNTSLFLTWSVWLIFSSTTFQNFSSISDLLSEVSNFQYYKMLCSKCITSLVSSLNVSPICWRNESFPFWMLFFYDNPVFNFTCTSCIICYHTTQIAEIFHILQLLLILHYL